MRWGYLVTVVLAGVMPVMTWAQTINVDQATLFNRLDRMERRLMALEQKVFAHSAASSDQTSLADYEIRMQEMERESTELYGTVEKIGNAMDTMATRLERLTQDLEMRLQDLEKQPLQKAQQPVEKKTEAPAPKAIPEQEKPVSLAIPEDMEPEKLYKQAYNYLTAAQYPVAQEWLETFLTRFPEHKLADNAYYWLGEVHLVQGQADKAVIAFKDGLANFPQGMKAAGNLLKMGVALKQLGQPHHAKSAWKKLLTDYPDSAEASKAKAYLENRDTDNG